MSLSDVNLRELAELGWTLVPCAASGREFEEIAWSLGTPVVDSNGGITKTIRPTPSSEAKPGSLSSHFGIEEFPLHTDTAFWPIPAKFLVMQVHGDLRRSTHIVPFDKCLRDSSSLVRRSVWLIREGKRFVYHSMTFEVDGEVGLRFDPVCMLPANKSAILLRDMFSVEYKELPVHTVTWQPDVALVVANWKVLHARGTRPPDEGERLLSRIYVR